MSSLDEFFAKAEDVLTDWDGSSDAMHARAPRSDDDTEALPGDSYYEQSTRDWLLRFQLSSVTAEPAQWRLPRSPGIPVLAEGGVVVGFDGASDEPPVFAICGASATLVIVDEVHAWTFRGAN